MLTIVVGVSTGLLTSLLGAVVGLLCSSFSELVGCRVFIAFVLNSGLSEFPENETHIV